MSFRRGEDESAEWPPVMHVSRREVKMGFKVSPWPKGKMVLPLTEKGKRLGKKGRKLILDRLCKNTYQVIRKGKVQDGEWFCGEKLSESSHSHDITWLWSRDSVGLMKWVQGLGPGTHPRSTSWRHSGRNQQRRQKEGRGGDSRIRKHSRLKVTWGKHIKEKAVIITVINRSRKMRSEN